MYKVNGLWQTTHVAMVASALSSQRLRFRTSPNFMAAEFCPLTYSALLVLETMDSQPYL